MSAELPPANGTEPVNNGEFVPPSSINLDLLQHSLAAKDLDIAHFEDQRLAFSLGIVDFTRQEVIAETPYQTEEPLRLIPKELLGRSIEEVHNRTKVHPLDRQKHIDECIAILRANGGAYPEVLYLNKVHKQLSTRLHRRLRKQTRQQLESLSKGITDVMIAYGMAVKTLRHGAPELIQNYADRSDW